MRFIDSNTFIHALLKTSRRLEKHEQTLKEGAKQIILRIEQGEEALTTIVHISEITNILEARMPSEAREILMAITSQKTLRLTDV